MLDGFSIFILVLAVFEVKTGISADEFVKKPKKKNRKSITHQRHQRGITKKFNVLSSLLPLTFSLFLCLSTFFRFMLERFIFLFSLYVFRFFFFPLSNFLKFSLINCIFLRGSILSISKSYMI